MLSIPDSWPSNPLVYLQPASGVHVIDVVCAENQLFTLPSILGKLSNAFNSG